jgi:hypothetical protein
MTIEIAKKIYCDIMSAIKDFEKDNGIYCAIPPFIELDGVIYQHYQCLDEEDLFGWGQKAGQQMIEVSSGRVKFYYDKSDDK